MSVKAFSYLVLSLLISICPLLSAQQSQKSHVQMRVHMIGETEEFGKFGYAAVDTFQNLLRKKNLLSPEENQFATDLVLDIKEINDQQAAVSVIILDPVPKEAVDLAANAELLYSRLSEEKKANLPFEGKAIRQYASAEYMKQFKMLFNSYLEVIDKDEIGEFFRKILREYTGE